MSLLRNTFFWIFIVLVTISLSLLVIFEKISGDLLVGFLGTIIGVIISEISHNQASNVERTHQMRLAALDRRLNAHQEAFTLWRELIFNLDKSEKSDDIVIRCQDWWNNNCLYLTADARHAFSKAFLSVGLYQVAILDRNNSSLVKQVHKDIISAGDIIVTGVELFEDEFNASSLEDLIEHIVNESAKSLLWGFGVSWSTEDIEKWLGSFVK